METNNAPARVVRAHTVDPDANGTDIAAAVCMAAADAIAAVPQIAGWTRASAPRLAWSYLRDRIDYIPEMGDQYVRMPWATMRQRRADCKSQAVFVAALCGAAGANVVLRFVQLAGAEHLGHVYAVIDGVPVDPLLPFGHESDAVRSVDVPVGNGEA